MDLVTLYIVDNCLLDRISYKRILESEEKFKILGDFSLANDCILKMNKRQSDMVITDIDLPDINGIRFIKILKEKFPKIKVAVLSSYRDSQIVLASLAYGACCYVLKNSKNVDLINAIKMAMEGKFYMDIELTRSAFSLFPPANLNDLENLYINKKIKNSLTLRELEVLKLLADGKTNAQIAKEIIVSTNTAKAHVGNILSKLSAKDRVEAVAKALRANIV